MQKNNTTKIEAQGGEIITRNSYGDVAIIPRNLVKKYQAYMKAACDECIDELVASLPAMHQYAADGTVIPQGKKVKVTLPDGEQAEYSTDSVEYKNLYNSGKLANVVKDKTTGEDTYVMPPLKEVEIVGKATGAAREMIDTKKNYTKEQYIKEKLPAFAGSLGVTPSNLGGNAEGYKRAINTKVAENIFKRKPNAKEKDLTPYELEVINNSDLDYKIKANLAERFEQGVLSVGNAGSPVKFKNPNLTQAQAERESTPLNMLAPLEAGSKAVRKLIGDDDKPNVLKDIALDPLNLLIGAGLLKGTSKFGKTASALNKEHQIAGGIENVTTEVNAVTNVPAVNNGWGMITTELTRPGFDPNLTPAKLTLKSVTPGSSLEGRVNKAGEINVSDILAHTNKQATSKADKTILEEVLNEHYQGQTKLNYKEFTDKVNEKLIPLEERKVELYKSYGLDNIYSDENAVKLKALIKEYNDLASIIASADEVESGKISSRLAEILEERKKLEDLKAQNYIENSTVLYENEKAFGKGNADHFNENTLGHSRHVITKEEPDVMHVLESQSDYYQKSEIPSLDDLAEVKGKTTEEVFSKNRTELNELQEKLNALEAEHAFSKNYEDVTKLNKNIEETKKELIEKMRITTEYENKMIDLVGRTKSYSQKILLKDSHPKRFLQEQFNYAGRKGLKKLRYPTPETAIKIQGYPKDTPTVDVAGNTVMDYSPKHKTIIKKYAEFSKLAKKTTSKDVRIVTDSHGNTWYELDVPEAFKEGKGTIEALSVIPPAVVGAATLKDQLNNSKSKRKQ